MNTWFQGSQADSRVSFLRINKKRELGTIVINNCKFKKQNIYAKMQTSESWVSNFYQKPF